MGTLLSRQGWLHLGISREMEGWSKVVRPRDHFNSPIQPGGKYLQVIQTSPRQGIRVVKVGERHLLLQQFWVGEAQTSQAMDPRGAGSFLLVSKKASDLPIANLILLRANRNVVMNLCADSHSAFYHDCIL